ncbi:hypothetical protein VOLCADRAFT_105403 [Volvox carteri f. nagariensis]|uniref:EF-hand domain-containing protein n=1 Tax=Volvox carteri f. nagariensis TaxID=3068 RepID=D8U0L6_VOLCA|nr:uncharacterized protein VOLCADRAFT_105403 [Volvox carteri f. nagariensis]EFJ46656.1 hypothetical protein VOLCADRAFT_105403 [Volvox carteri f. nagariensis]|eukprot:XP_002952185.1 hypothetical protein VOLCADRAFT_105403 [Volvox carteri f. nagariensis]
MGAGCSTESSAETEQPRFPPTQSVSIERTKSGKPSEEEAAPAPRPKLSGPPVEVDLKEVERDHGDRDQAARLDALRRCFEALDKDKSGSIDAKELKQYLFKTGVNVSHISDKAEELMRKMDVNDDQLISLAEFSDMMEALLTDKSDEDLDVWVAEVVFTASSRNVVGFGNTLGEVLQNLEFKEEQAKKIKTLFKELDRDKSGFVELHELRLLLGKSGMDMEQLSEEVLAIMAKLDKNGDNKVSTQEFYVTLSAIRKSLRSDEEFMALLDNVLAVAKAPEAATEKPALAEVLLAEDF